MPYFFSDAQIWRHLYYVKVWCQERSTEWEWGVLAQFLLGCMTICRPLLGSSILLSFKRNSRMDKFATLSHWQSKPRTVFWSRRPPAPTPAQTCSDDSYNRIIFLLPGLQVFSQVWPWAPSNDFGGPSLAPSPCSWDHASFLSAETAEHWERWPWSLNHLRDSKGKGWHWEWSRSVLLSFVP